jgi:hypothetical protein
MHSPTLLVAAEAAPGAVTAKVVPNMAKHKKGKTGVPLSLSSNKLLQPQ